MSARAPARHPAGSGEPRWPAALAILAVLGLVTVLPERMRAVPLWTVYAAVAVVLVPMAAVTIAPAHAAWLRIERAILFLATLAAAVLTVENLRDLTIAIVFSPGNTNGLALLSSAVAVWVTNILIFSLVYWLIDRGGPNTRGTPGALPADWLFAQMQAPEYVAADWRPSFADYLALGFTTSTAFSPTDALPLTPRAKLLMLAQSSISLVALVVVAARAINVLGSR